jgi:hypothetical protein
MRRRGGASAWLGRLTALHVVGQLWLSNQKPPVRLAGYSKDEGEFKPCSADGCSGTMKQTERRGKSVWLCQQKVSHTEDVIAKP